MIWEPLSSSKAKFIPTMCIKWLKMLQNVYIEIMSFWASHDCPKHQFALSSLCVYFFRGQGMMIGIDIVEDQESRKPSKEGAEMLSYKWVLLEQWYCYNDRACHSVGHYWDYYPGTLSLHQISETHLKNGHR